MVAIDTAGKTLWQLVEERATVTPDARMARDEAGRTLTFGEYHQWCLRAAAGFHDLGVNEGSNVSWVLPSRFESLVLAGALARLGAVQNPILPIYRHREVGFITRQSHCSMLVVPGTFRGFHYPDMAAEALQGLDATIVVADPDLPTGDPASLPPYRAALDELRWLFYSSGTTADPKGAKHTDRTISAANDGMQWSMQVTDADRAAVVFPITHVGGLVWLFNTLQTGVELLMVEAFNPAETPHWLGRNGCTCAGAGTVFWMTYLNAQRQLPAGERLLPEVRIFNGGGAPKPVTLHAEMMDAFGAPLIGGWGLTESPINTMVHVDDPDDKKANTDGRACPGVSIRTVMDGVETARGVEGELRVKGGQVCMGYLDASLDAEAVQEQVVLELAVVLQLGARLRHLVPDGDGHQLRHHRDVVRELVRSGAKDFTDFSVNAVDVARLDAAVAALPVAGAIGGTVQSTGHHKPPCPPRRCRKCRRPPLRLLYDAAWRPPPIRSKSPTIPPRLIHSRPVSIRPISLWDAVPFCPQPTSKA